MELDGEIYISQEYKRKDYIRLGLTYSSDQATWGRAIDMFEDRIKGRYLHSIIELNRNDYMHGFSIMAINCLLVDTLGHFVQGKPKTNSMDYVEFLLHIFDQKFSLGEPGDCYDAEYEPRQTRLYQADRSKWDAYWATMFYKDIRCSILHAAQTQMGSRLTVAQDTVITKTEAGKLSVDVSKFTSVLIGYYHNYINDLREGGNEELRRRFLKQMNFVCYKDGNG